MDLEVTFPLRSQSLSIVSIISFLFQKIHSSATDFVGFVCPWFYILTFYNFPFEFVVFRVSFQMSVGIRLHFVVEKLVEEVISVFWCNVIVSIGFWFGCFSSDWLDFFLIFPCICWCWNFKSYGLCDLSLSGKKRLIQLKQIHSFSPPALFCY